MYFKMRIFTEKSRFSSNPLKIISSFIQVKEKIFVTSEDSLYEFNQKAVTFSCIQEWCRGIEILFGFSDVYLCIRNLRTSIFIFDTQKRKSIFQFDFLFAFSSICYYAGIIAVEVLKFPGKFWIANAQDNSLLLYTICIEDGIIDFNVQRTISHAHDNTITHLISFGGRCWSTAADETIKLWDSCMHPTIFFSYKAGNCTKTIHSLVIFAQVCVNLLWVQDVEGLFLAYNPVMY